MINLWPVVLSAAYLLFIIPLSSVVAGPLEVVEQEYEVGARVTDILTNWQSKLGQTVTIYGGLLLSREEQYSSRIYYDIANARSSMPEQFKPKIYVEALPWVMDITQVFSGRNIWLSGVLREKPCPENSETCPWLEDAVIAIPDEYLILDGTRLYSDYSGHTEIRQYLNDFVERLTQANNTGELEQISQLFVNEAQPYFVDWVTDQKSLTNIFFGQSLNNYPEYLHDDLNRISTFLTEPSLEQSRLYGYDLETDFLDSDYTYAYWCQCRTNDCDGRWPRHIFNRGNRGYDTSYYCFAVTLEDDRLKLYSLDPLPEGTTEKE